MGVKYWHRVNHITRRIIRPLKARAGTAYIPLRSISAAHVRGVIIFHDEFLQVSGLFYFKFRIFVNDSYSLGGKDVNLINRYKNVLAAAKEVGIGELPNSSLRILWFRSFHEPGTKRGRS